MSEMKDDFRNAGELEHSRLMQEICESCWSEPSSKMEELLKRIVAIPDEARGNLEFQIGLLLQDNVPALIRAVQGVPESDQRALLYTLLCDLRLMLTSYRLACKYLVYGWQRPGEDARL